MDPAKPSSKSLVSYHLFKLCLSLVCFHLIADVQVPLTTSRNYLLDGKSSFVYWNLLVISGLKCWQLFYLHADMQHPLNVNCPCVSYMPAWF